MIQPNFPAFRRFALQGNLVAVMKQLPADLETPVSSFLKLAHRAPHAFLLESAEQDERIGRYSFIGLEPKTIFIDTGHTFEIIKNGKKKTLERKGDILGLLRTEMMKYHLANQRTLPGFCGGLVGYLGYECVEDFETIRLDSAKKRIFPKSIFFLTNDLLIFDHYRKTLTIVILVELLPRENKGHLYKEAVKKIAAYEDQLGRPIPRSRRPVQGAVRPLRLQSNMTPKAFEQKVRRIQQYIRAGDCIQVVLSQKFTLPKPKDDFSVYRALRSINPSPYMFYFRSKDIRLIGSSPELLVKKTGRQAEVRPIAGTRPRGETPAQDAAYEEQLKRSRKERAEHLMLVDLGRNDLGRVCRFDSVKVKNFAHVEKYSHVMHLVSDVSGRLQPRRDAFDLVRATFPAGTVSGAPKIRAMQIIDELEPEPRGPYAGALGYFSFNRNMDMCLTIRTLVSDGKHLYLQAGAGIVKDSRPQREYEETVNKARALLKAVAHRGDFSCSL